MGRKGLSFSRSSGKVSDPHLAGELVVERGRLLRILLAWPLGSHGRATAKRPVRENSFEIGHHPLNNTNGDSAGD